MEDLIDCDSAIYYVRFMTGKVVIEKMISLNVKIFAVKKVAGLVLEVVKVNEDNIQKKLALT